MRLTNDIKPNSCCLSMQGYGGDHFMVPDPRLPASAQISAQRGIAEETLRGSAPAVSLRSGSAANAQHCSFSMFQWILHQLAT